MNKGKDLSHVTRLSDASTFDEVCINCGATDQVPGGWGKLAELCSKPVGKGGITLEEWSKGPMQPIAVVNNLG